MLPTLSISDGSIICFAAQHGKHYNDGTHDKQIDEIINLCDSQHAKNIVSILCGRDCVITADEDSAIRGSREWAEWLVSGGGR